MHILLIELQPTGHRLSSYVHHITRAAIERSWRVDLLTSQESVGHPALKQLVDRFPLRLGVHVIRIPQVEARSNAFLLLVKQFVTYAALLVGLRRLFKSHSYDAAYVVSLDTMDKACWLLGWPFSRPAFFGMLMAPGFHRTHMDVGPPTKSDWLYRWLYRLMIRKRRLRGITVIDECFYEYAASLPWSEKVHYVGDVGDLSPPEERRDLRQELDVQPSACVLLLYGSLTLRKGVRELLAALELTQGRDIVALLAGQQDEEARRVIDGFITRDPTNPPRIRIIDGFLSPEMEYEAFAASDVVWLGYAKGFYKSSGVLFQAGQLGRPVLAADRGLVGWLVRRHGLGLTVTPEDPAAVAEALRTLAEDEDLRRECGVRARRLALEHDGMSFGHRVCDVLGEQRGVASERTPQGARSER